MGKKISPETKNNIIENCSKKIKQNAAYNNVSDTSVKNTIRDKLNGLLDDNGNYIGVSVGQEGGYITIKRPLLIYKKQLECLLNYNAHNIPLLFYDHYPIIS